MIDVNTVIALIMLVLTAVGLGKQIAFYINTKKRSPVPQRSAIVFVNITGQPSSVILLCFHNNTSGVLFNLVQTYFTSFLNVHCPVS